MSKKGIATAVVTEYARMWPRSVFSIDQPEASEKVRQALDSKVGVYVLYREDRPYYIGQATQSLWKRLNDHASHRQDRYFNFWNFFTAFVVPEARYIDELEGILIAAFGEAIANSKGRKITPIPFPRKASNYLKQVSVRSTVGQRNVEND